MALTLKKILFVNVPRSALALLAGYTLWYTLQSHHTVTVAVEVPLCFYASIPTCIIDAPATVTVHLCGKRKYLASLDFKQLAAHINASNFTLGNNPIVITGHTLFLPESIKLIHYTPSCITALVSSAKDTA